MISAVVIARNEEKMIKDCFESLVWCDEILLVDNGSTDATVKIAKDYKARVVEYASGKNFSDSRNKGLQEAKGDWIFYLDADERVTPALREEIKQVVKSSEAKFNAYAIPRRNFIFGKEFRYGGQWPDYQKRFFQKSGLKGWEGEVHEEPRFAGELGYLAHPIIHLKEMTVAQMIEKTNNWSEYEAKLMLAAHHPPMTVPRFLTAMLREFWLRMVRQTAFLDGPKGVIYALYQVFSRFVSYAKLWEMQENAGSHI